MTKTSVKKGKEIEHHLSKINMDPWYYIYENFVRGTDKKDSSQGSAAHMSATNEQKSSEENQHDRQHLISETKVNIQEYEEKCRKIFEDDEVRFVALLDEYGTTLAGGYKQGINPRLTAEQHQSVCQELASRVTKRKKFDTELGRVKYSASRREHVVIMSFPINEKVIMIVAEPNVNIDRLSYRIISKLGSQWGDFVGQ